PFIPGSIVSGVGLDTPLMSQFAGVTGNDRIHRLENYYSRDLETSIATWQTFAWRVADINQIVSWDNLIDFFYPSHSGPIQFYGDTVQVTFMNEARPPGLYGLGCPFDYSQVGWL